MSISAQITLVFLAHVGFVFGAYGSHFLGLHLPGYFFPAIWLGLPSVIAAFAYSETIVKSRTFGGVWRPAVFAIVATGISLYVGVFLAFNTFGT